MNTRPHIALNAHLLSGEASYRSAGIHRYLYHSLAHLPDVAPEFAYTVFVGAGSLPDHLDLAIRRTRLPTVHPFSRIVWEQVVAPFVLARARPDLLHGMAFSLPLAWPGPSVVTIFDLSFLRYPGRLPAARRLYLSWMTRVSARRARRVIAISESARFEIGALLGVPLANIDVAYPGVDAGYHPLPPDEVAAFRAGQGLPDRFILYLGTLEPRKNLETLVRAFARLPQRGEVKLVLAGGRGWQTGSLFELVEELALSDDLLLPGYVPGNSLPMWYNAAEIFAFPSVYEGFGMPLAEAMTCGVPVVASNTTSLPEAIGPGGIMCPPTDVDAWVASLSHLLEEVYLD
jgi:glycosyltransferase involved in cell wall biosynthesis